MSYRVLSAMVMLALAAATTQAREQDRCHPPVIGRAALHAVIDARTIATADGRAVRLAGIEIAARPADAIRAKYALERHLAGSKIELRQLGARADRYGRVLALVVAASAAGQQHVSAQHWLLATGHARVAARVGDAACAAAFLRAERTARAAGLGLWSDPYYVVRKADRPGEILAERGRFTLVEGSVQSVRESGGTIYVNFSRRWSDDFTVTVARRNERAFIAAGMPLRKLAGQRVRVRGIVEERGGPWIEVLQPEQIEIAERD